MYMCILHFYISLFVPQFEVVMEQSSMTVRLGAAMPPTVPILILLSLHAAVEVPWLHPSQGS